MKKYALDCDTGAQKRQRSTTNARSAMSTEQMIEHDIKEQLHKSRLLHIFKFTYKITVRVSRTLDISPTCSYMKIPHCTGSIAINRSPEYQSYQIIIQAEIAEPYLF